MKPIILGMNNPLSSDPAHALYPSPEGCTGHRLWRMLHARTGASRSEYLEAFDRRNLVGQRTWSRMSEAREAASHFLRELMGHVEPITVLVLGAEPRDAIRLPRVLVKPVEMYGVTWRLVPHPSGRNLWYNVKGNRETVELLLEELYRGAGVRPEQGALL